MTDKIPDELRDQAVMLWNEIAWEDDPSIKLAAALLRAKEAGEREERERWAEIIEDVGANSNSRRAQQMCTDLATVIRQDTGRG